MRAWIVPKGCTKLEQLRLVDRPEPVAGRRDVVVRVRATSLNYRDQAVVAGQYFGGAVSRDLIPMSDGAGDVIAVGSEVTRFKPGARVAATFFQPGPQPMALGSPLDGVLAERVSLNEDGLVSIPEHLSYEEAACLPCAAVTAWHALFHAGRPLKAGDTVLVLGTGGVSIAALQFAKATGARVIATSSSDDKAARARGARRVRCCELRAHTGMGAGSQDADVRPWRRLRHRNRRGRDAGAIDSIACA
jgi:NADPH:quinone reductase-like Zn-dependent oxidoreductase